MAVGKEAPLPSMAIAALAHRKALEAVVEEFTSTFASLSATTIKRRLKDACITMPEGFGNNATIECKTEQTKSAAASSIDEIL